MKQSLYLYIFPPINEAAALKINLRCEITHIN